MMSRRALLRARMCRSGSRQEVQLLGPLVHTRAAGSRLGAVSATRSLTSVSWHTQQPSSRVPFSRSVLGGSQPVSVIASGRVGSIRRFGLFDGLKKKLEELAEEDEELKKNVEKLKKETSGVTSKAKESASGLWEQANAAQQEAQKAAAAAQKAAAAAREKMDEAGESKAASKFSEQAKLLKEKAAKLRAQAEEAAGSAKGAFGENEYVKDAKAKVDEAKAKVDEATDGAAEKLGGKKRLQSRFSQFSDVMGQVFGAKKKKTGPVTTEYPWMEYLDATEKLTYYNKITKEIRREKPADFDEMKGHSVVGEQSAATGIAVVQKESSAWERVTEKLRQAPIISAVYAAAEEIATSEPVKNVKTAVADKTEDVRETWETSQNPWVYRTSYAVDSMFAETEEAQTIREIKKLDSDFNMPDFVDDMKDEIIPAVVQAFLEADRTVLAFWLTDDAFARINAALKAREVANLVVDTTILAVSHCEVVSCLVGERGPPKIVCQVMCQQINCTKNREGEIVEGGENEIRAVFYAFAMQRVYHDKRNEITWQVADLGVVGNQLYL